VAKPVDIRDQGLQLIFSIVRQIRRTEVINVLLRAHAGTVISGPFAGMRLLPEASWWDGDLPPKDPRMLRGGAAPRGREGRRPKSKGDHQRRLRRGILCGGAWPGCCRRDVSTHSTSIRGPRTFARLPEISRCDMIVECYDSLNPLITQIRKQRFSASDDIENISEGPRDPNRFASFRLWESLDRWLAIDEGRPSTMNRLVCWAH
jgi:hypothetical protein